MWEKILWCHFGNFSLDLSSLLFPPIFSDGSSGAKKVKLTRSLKVSGCSGGMSICSRIINEKMEPSILNKWII